MRNGVVFRFICFVLLTLGMVARAASQEPVAEEKPIVESVDIEGVAESRISTEMRELTRELVGQRFDQLTADEVAYQLQNSLNERISAIRQTPGTDNNHIKLIFEFGGMRLDFRHEPNVNSRYTIEEVRLIGVSESSISMQLREEMHQLVGQKLDDDVADEIRNRLND